MDSYWGAFGVSRMGRLLLCSVKTTGGNKVDVGFGFGTHQQFNHLVQGAALKKDSVQARHQRHVDVELLRFDLEHFERVDTFCHLAQT